MNADDDIDRWLDTLRGRRQGPDRRDQVVAEALRAEITGEPAWSGRDQDGLTTLIDRLRAEGLLAGETPDSRPAPHPGHVSNRRTPAIGVSARTLHRRTFVLRAVAASLVIAMLVGGVWWTAWPNRAPVVASHDFIDIAEVSARDVRATASQIEQALNAFGIQASRTNADGGITLDFDVPDTNWRRVADWAKTWSLDCTGPGRYRFVVRAA